MAVQQAVAARRRRSTSPAPATSPTAHGHRRRPARPSARTTASTSPAAGAALQRRRAGRRRRTSGPTGWRSATRWRRPWSRSPPRCGLDPAAGTRELAPRRRAALRPGPPADDDRPPRAATDRYLVVCKGAPESRPGRAAGAPTPRTLGELPPPRDGARRRRAAGARRRRGAAADAAGRPGACRAGLRPLGPGRRSATRCGRRRPAPPPAFERAGIRLDPHHRRPSRPPPRAIADQLGIWRAGDQVARRRRRRPDRGPHRPVAGLRPHPARSRSSTSSPRCRTAATSSR